MRVNFLFYEDCPSHELALERLREVLAEEGIDALSRLSRSRAKSRPDSCASSALPPYLLTIKT